MEKEVFVYIDLNSTTHFVGCLWSRARRGHESASFEYSHEWLKNNNRFALEPALTLTQGAHHTPGRKVLFGAIGDSAPDRWGRMLMRRAARIKAENEQYTPRSLMEIDYLLAVNDFARIGALRFTDVYKGTFLATNENTKIPPLIELPKLLYASDKLINDDVTYEEIKLLLAHGSSLGGARPKASVLDKDGSLLIAKFPHKQDEYDTVTWEAVCLELAKQAKIQTTCFRLEQVNNMTVLLLNRFDRDEQKRSPFLSAMSMLGANDNEQRSYLDIADAIRMHGAKPQQDLTELWRRMIFNILISNTDDHLRNHGFLYVDQQGWTLSPAYDLNPTPTDIKPRFLSTSIDYDDNRASIDLAMQVREYFVLSKQSAHEIISEVTSVVSNWQTVAQQFNISTSQIKRMRSAFEHDDLIKAQKISDSIN